MERVQVLKFSKVLFSAILFAMLFSSCASKRFVEVNKEEFLREEEYDSVIAVTPKEPEKNSAGKSELIETNQQAIDLKPEEQKASKDTAETKVSPKKKNKKETKKVVHLIPKKVEKKGLRLPEMEDSEGFEGRRPKQDPFRVGERVELDVKYLGVVAGTLSLQVLPFVEVNGRKAYHFRVSVKSNSSFSLFFKVDDWSDTYVDYESLLPFNYTTHVDHSNEKKEIKVLLDHTKNLVKIWEKKIDKSGSMKKKNHEWTMAAFSQNVISIFFYIRNFQLKENTTYKVPMTDEDNNMILEAKVIGKEEISTPIGKYKTIVLEPKASVKGKFKQNGEVKLWLTDDDRKLIVKVVAELQIGKLRFELSKLNL